MAKLRWLDAGFLGLFIITCVLLYIAGSWGYQAIKDAEVERIKAEGREGVHSHERYLKQVWDERGWDWEEDEQAPVRFRPESDGYKLVRN